MRIILGDERVRALAAAKATLAKATAVAEVRRFDFHAAIDALHEARMLVENARARIEAATDVN